MKSMDTRSLKLAVLYALTMLATARAEQNVDNDGPKPFYVIAAGTCTMGHKTIIREIVR